MSKILTQEEVDAIIDAVKRGDYSYSPSGGDIKNSKKEKLENGKVVVTYDLSSQDRIIRGRLPMLDVIYEKLMRNFRVSLSNKLRTICAMNHTSTEFLKFGEFINTLPMPTPMTIVRSETLHGPFLVVTQSSLVYSLVDKLFGGGDRPYTKMEGKEFSKIELATLRDIEEIFINDFSNAWEGIHTLNPKIVRTEVNPQFVGICPPTDIVIAATFEVELENASGTFTIVIPYNTIESIKGKLSTGFQIDDGRTREKLKDLIGDELKEAKVEVTAFLGTASISIAKLKSLKVGDQLILSQDADKPVGGFIEGKRVLELKVDEKQTNKLTVLGGK
jgi:flagellar motor switch protein FliM